MYLWEVTPVCEFTSCAGGWFELFNSINYHFTLLLLSEHSP